MRSLSIGTTVTLTKAMASLRTGAGAVVQAASDRQANVNDSVERRRGKIRKSEGMWAPVADVCASVCIAKRRTYTTFVHE
jgi:hypothetical protein